MPGRASTALPGILLPRTILVLYGLRRSSRHSLIHLSPRRQELHLPRRHLKLSADGAVPVCIAPGFHAADHADLAPLAQVVGAERPS